MFAEINEKTPILNPISLLSKDNLMNNLYGLKEDGYVLDLATGQFFNPGKKGKRGLL
jgi:hypothetical protein